MDEIEMRVAALEAAMTELVAWLPAEAAEDARRGLLDIPSTAGGEERSIRHGAAALLQDGLRRFAPPPVGMVI